MGRGWVCGFGVGPCYLKRGGLEVLPIVAGVCNRMKSLVRKGWRLASARGDGWDPPSPPPRDPRLGPAGSGTRQPRSVGPGPINLCPTRKGPSLCGMTLPIARLYSVGYSLVLQRRVAYPARPARPLARSIMLPGSGTNSSSTTGCSSSTTAARTSPAKLAG